MTSTSSRRTIRIDVVTTSRADYSLIAPIARALARREGVEVRLVFTGAHYADNEKEGLDALIAGCGLPSASLPAEGIGRSKEASAAAMAAMTSAFGRHWADRPPAACVLLGDRYELLPPASVAVLYGMALVHVFGGEEDVSYCLDTQVRNAITKMAHLHLVMHAAMRERLLRMDEEAWRIVVIGNPALDGRRRDGGAAFRAAAASKGWGAGPYLAACYLPATAFPGRWTMELEALLAALEHFPSHTVIWAGVNADPESPLIKERLLAYCATRNNHFFVNNLGAELFASLLEASDAIVGNSSSGLLEAPSHGLPNVTVGVRQTGRLTGDGALIVPAEAGAIRSSLAKAIGDAEFRQRIAASANPYYRPNAADAAADSIVTALKRRHTELMLKRSLPDNPREWMGLKRVPEHDPVRTSLRSSPP